MLAVIKSCKTDHSIQRCTQLVAHIQQERVFQLLRFLSLCRLFLQFHLRVGHFRLVAAHAHIVGNLTFLVLDRHHSEVQIDIAAFLVTYNGA